MKKLLCTSLLALAVSTANAATYKSESFYVRGDVGANMFSNKDARKALGKTQFVGGLGAGYRFNSMFRTDLNVHYRHASHSGRKMSFYEPFLNAYYDIETQSIFTPYVTAGVGYSFIRNKNQDGTKSKFNSFSWNAGFGSRAQLSKDVDLDLGYRFLGLENKKLKASIDGKKPYAHQVTLGLIYNL